MTTTTADCSIYYDFFKKDPYKPDPAKATDSPYHLYCKWTEVTELG